MSTSAASSSEEAERRDAGGGGGGGDGDGDGFRRASPSRIRRRFANQVWPAPFLEALAAQVAIAASHSQGRLAAAPALCTLFQVSSTWRVVSRSELLWQNLTRQIWNRDQLLFSHNNWHEEFIYRHRTAHNFRQHRYIYSTLQFLPAGHNHEIDNDDLSCRRLAISDRYVAAGLSDGSVWLFHLQNRVHLSTFWPHHRDRLGRFSSSVSGIILSDAQLVFASLDGDIHVAIINQPNATRRAHLGDVVNDGALMDFTGCNQWWIGLYAGVPGRAFRIWNSETEELVFLGGSLTDPDAVMGWHLLTEQPTTALVGRVRVTGNETAVACTSVRVMVLDLRNPGIILGQEEFPRGLVVGCVDARDGSIVVVDSRGSASIRQVRTLEERSRFMVRGASSQRENALGCMNGGYAILFIAGVVRVWDIENGGYLYSFRERIANPSALVADERLVAACSNDNAIQLWDFGEQ